MNISALARQTGLRPSAIRYYESIGIIAAPARRSGQRIYDSRAVRRLAVIRQAQNAGFTLDEARQMLQSDDLAREWDLLSSAKLAQLTAQIAELQAKQELLRRVRQQCHCRTADECGGQLLEIRGTPMLSST